MRPEVSPSPAVAVAESRAWSRAGLRTVFAIALLALFALGRFALMSHELRSSSSIGTWIAAMGSAQRLGGDLVLSATNAAAFADPSRRAAWGDSIRVRALRLEQHGLVLARADGIPEAARAPVLDAARSGEALVGIVGDVLVHLSRVDSEGAHHAAEASQLAKARFDARLDAAVRALSAAQSAREVHLNRLALAFVVITLGVLAVLALRVVLPTIGESRAVFHAVVEAHELTEGVISGAHDGIFAFDRARRFTLWNPAMERLHGRTRAEVLGKSLAEIFPDRVASGLESAFDGALRGETVVVRRRDLVARATGAVAIVDATYHPLRDAAGNVTGGVGILRDVTEERRSAQQVERLSAIVEQTQEGVVMTDGDGRLTWVNPAWERITGWALAAVIGRSPGELLGGAATDPAVAESMGRAVRAGEPVSGEILNYRRDGTPFWMSFHITPMRDAEGEVTSFLAIHHDVTSAREREIVLRAERAFAASLVAANSDGLLAVDSDFRVTEWNPTIERWTKRPRAAALGQTLDEMFPVDDAERRRERFERLFSTGEPFTLERAYRFAPSASPLFVEAVVSPIRDLVTREVTGALCTVRDLSERQAADERFRVLFDDSSDAYLLFDESGIIDCNDATLRMLRATHKAEILALHPAVLSPDAQPDGRSSLEKGVEMVTTAHREGFHRFDWTHRRSDGSDLSVEVSLTPVTLRGRRAVLGIWHDLTERHEAEAAVRRERERLGDAITALDSGFAMFDEEERLVACNPRFEAFWPDGAGPASGATLRGLVEGLVALRRPRASARAERQWVERTMSRLRGAGDRFEERVGASAQRVSVARTRDGGSVVLFTDISELKATQESLVRARDAANAASRAKSAFLASMSHELRTPLNSIIGFSRQVLKNRHRGLHPQDQLFVERVAHNGLHLLSLINRVLDLSKIEAGRFEMNIAPTDLGALVRETVLLLDAELATAGGSTVALRAVVPELLLPLETDAEQLRQVLINLVANALKFTPEGMVTVLVESSAAHHPTAVLVRDTGIGIPPDRLEAIFEPFEQASDTTARDYGGTGLGLAISRSICTLLGATLEVTSAVGAGTEFRIGLATRG